MRNSRRYLMHATVTRPLGSSLIQMRILMTADEAHKLAEMLKSEVQDLDIFLKDTAGRMTWTDKDEDEPDQYNRIDYDFESFIKGEVNDD